MRIRYINSDGAGFSGLIEVPDGTTVGQLFRDKMGPGVCPNDFLVRVNRQSVGADEVLKEGDRVSISPRKVEGAA